MVRFSRLDIFRLYLRILELIKLWIKIIDLVLKSDLSSIKVEILTNVRVFLSQPFQIFVNIIRP